MLKYVFAFFAFILVSLAPVHADEGYIPYFPDALEPHGIGFRGPAKIEMNSQWTTASKYLNSGEGLGEPFARGESRTLASPFTLEFRKNYFFS